MQRVKLFLRRLLPSQDQCDDDGFDSSEEHAPQVLYYTPRPRDFQY